MYVHIPWMVVMRLTRAVQPAPFNLIEGILIAPFE